MDKCSFKFRCDIKWEQLRAGSEPGVKFCENCERNVFLTKKEVESSLFCSLNQCIAIAEDYEYKYKIGQIGEPEHVDWMELLNSSRVYARLGDSDKGSQLLALEMLLNRLENFPALIYQIEAGENVIITLENVQNAI